MQQPPTQQVVLPVLRLLSRPRRRRRRVLVVGARVRVRAGVVAVPTGGAPVRHACAGKPRVRKVLAVRRRPRVDVGVRVVERPPLLR